MALEPLQLLIPLLHLGDPPPNESRSSVFPSAESQLCIFPAPCSRAGACLQTGVSRCPPQTQKWRLATHEARKRENSFCSCSCGDNVQFPKGCRRGSSSRGPGLVVLVQAQWYWEQSCSVDLAVVLRALVPSLFLPCFLSLYSNLPSESVASLISSP